MWVGRVVTVLHATGGMLRCAPKCEALPMIHGVKTMKRMSRIPTCPTPNGKKRMRPPAQPGSIQDGFPTGVGKPALRALLAAGLTSGDPLTQVSAAELAALHGMGPKSISVMRAAMVAKGVDFRP